MTGAANSPDQQGQTPSKSDAPTDGAPVVSAALDSVLLKSALLHPQGWFGRVEVVDSAGSTNTDLADAAADAQQFWPDLSVLIADAQPSGKGRLGRSWDVPAGAAMISSILVFPSDPTANSQAGAQQAPVDFDATGYGWLSILAGVSLCEALRSVAGVPAELKWPNDVIIRGRKVAGILAQVVPARPGHSTLPGQRAQAGIGVVIGAGLNVSLEREQLPTDRATSLLLEEASTLDRNELLVAYLNKFAARYEQFAAAGGQAQAPLAGGASLLETTRKYMSTLGKEVRAELPGGTMLHGTAVGLGADGGLELRDEAGTIHHVSAGDVIHLRRTAADGTVKYA